MAVAVQPSHLGSGGSPVADRKNKFMRQPPVGGSGPVKPSASVASQEFFLQTKEIVHEVFHALLLDQGVKLNGYSIGVVMEPNFSSEVNKRAFFSLKAACRHFLRLHSAELVKKVERLDISDSTLCSTFHRAMYAMFSDDVNWGRIVALICFGVLVAMEAHKASRVLIIDSIEGWLLTFICSNLQQFIVKQKGWAGVPDKFNSDKLVTESSAKNGGSWLTLAAVGVGAALVTAFLTR